MYLVTNGSIWSQCMRKSSMEDCAIAAIFMKENTTKKPKNVCFFCRKPCKTWICKKCDKGRDDGTLDTKAGNLVNIYKTV